MTSLDDLHLSTDGPIPPAERDAVLFGPVSPLDRARWAVEHWRKEVAMWKRARQETLNCEYRRRALVNWDWARGELARAEERLREIESKVPSMSGVFDHLTRGV